MCDDHGLSRRQLFRGAGALAAAEVLLPRAAPPRRPPRRLPLRSPLRPQDASGDSAYSMAMHIHGSLSEWGGSMDAHASQATLNGVDTIWWSDHDERINNEEYRDTVHFTSLTKESGAPGQGGRWIWQRQLAGALASYAGGIVGTPCSPKDPVAGGALHVQAQAAGTGPATIGYFADSKPSGYNYRDSLAGQSLLIDVLPDKGWGRGYLEVFVESSHHGPSGGRGAGRYSLSYRLVPGGKGARTSQGRLGIITVPVAPGGWQTITIIPQEDIAVLWPEMDSRDFAVFGLTLRAVSEGDTVGGYFDYLRFDRTISGEAALRMRADMMSWLAARYPSVSQRQGLEVSGVNMNPHVNWFGPSVTILDYGPMTESQWEAHLSGTVIPQIHSGGGLASYNHPYGTGRQPLLPGATQDALLQQQAIALLGNNVLGADLLEVGYPSRGGVDLAHHVGLWDVLSRNAVFLTGNGVSDDHVGSNWKGQETNWVTTAWAASNGQADLLASMAAGRAWCGSLSEFALPSGAALDLVADGSCPMGSVSLSSAVSRELTVSATGIPPGGSVAVLKGEVDYAGQLDPTPNTKVLATFSRSELAAGGGKVTMKVDTSQPCFARTAALDGAGKTIGLSNPVWMLRNKPPGGIPGPRRC